MIKEQVHIEIEDETTIVRILSIIFIFFMILITFSYTDKTASTSQTSSTFSSHDSTQELDPSLVKTTNPLKSLKPSV